MRVFQLSPDAFTPFNCAPHLMKATITSTDTDGLTFSGAVKYFDHAWYKLGARGPTLAAASVGFLVDAFPVQPLGAYSIGMRGQSSIYASHFIRTSGALHRIQLMENIYSSWSYDHTGRRIQLGMAAPWEGVGRHHTLGVFYDRTKGLLYSTIDGVPVQERQATLDHFYPVLRVEAVGVEGEFDIRFENLRLAVLDENSTEILSQIDAWSSDYGPVFISYAHDDTDLVTPFRNALRRKGVRVLGDWDFLPGDALMTKIDSGIKRAGTVLACMSANSVASAWVKQELEIATLPELQASGLRVVPVVIGDCEIPSTLTSRIYHDIRPPRPMVSDQLLATLRARSW